MGDMADYQFDTELEALAIHRNGDCDMWCQYCYDELKPEEKLLFDIFSKQIFRD